MKLRSHISQGNNEMISTLFYQCGLLARFLIGGMLCLGTRTLVSLPDVIPVRNVKRLAAFKLYSNAVAVI